MCWCHACQESTRDERNARFASVLSDPQQRGKCSLSYLKVTNKKDASDKCCAVSARDEGGFRRAGFVLVQPFVTTLGSARVGAQAHGSDMMIAENEADLISVWIDSEIAKIGYCCQVCKTRKQALPGEGAGTNPSGGALMISQRRVTSKIEHIQKFPAMVHVRCSPLWLKFKTSSGPKKCC